MPWFQVFSALLLVVFLFEKILRIKAAAATKTTSGVDRWKGKEALSGGERGKKI